MCFDGIIFIGAVFKSPPETTAHYGPLTAEICSGTVAKVAYQHVRHMVFNGQ